MDQHKIHKPQCLSRTSRVNEKIIDYITNFVQDRDLEKFMRLDSPNSNKSRSRSRSKKYCGSHPTTTTPTSSSCGLSEDDTSCVALRRLFRLNNPDCESISGSSKSLPSMVLCGKSKQRLSDAKSEERIIPIKLEKDQHEKSAENEENISPEDLVTPRKSSHVQTKQTQTPDSVAKSHKRLEWDSLGDVGYKKSMSTSNISILERSILREFFQETTSTALSDKKATNAPESDLKTLHRELMNRADLEEKSPDCKNSSPPLASSTWVEPKRPISSSGTRPKYTTQGTSTSLLKKYEKFVQTSLPHGSGPAPSKQSQEVQVNMSSATPSMVGSSATPSSFEYCCSSLSNATSCNDGSAGEVQATCEPHPFVAGITEMLARRKALQENNNKSYKHKKKPEMEACNSVINILSESLTKALSENKENSGLENAKTPQLDLGIQLLCSLIDAKSLNRREKKLLIRDIVKKITRLANNNGDNGSLSSSLTSKRSSSSSVTVSRKVSDSHIITTARGKLSSTENIKESDMGQERGSTDNLDDEHVLKVDVYSQSSPPTTSAKALEKQAVKSTTTHQSKKYEKPSKVASPTNKCSEINKELLIDINLSGDAETGTRRSSSSTSATSSSKDLTTQKVAGEINNSTDAEATMREWLNPLTQSEIEYENKKLELAAKQKEKLSRRQKPDKERDAQLTWIEKEIQRLESLKYLLLKEDSNDSSDVAHLTKTKPKVRKEMDTQKLYDTVYSDQEKRETSSVQSESADQEIVMQEIEVIIEESNEDVINLNSNIKRSKQRRKETQIVYDKPAKEGVTNDIELNGKPRFRTMKEIVTTNEEQVLPIKEEEESIQVTKPKMAKESSVPVHRSKMDTPSGSNDSESVCSFVQQRKREFMEHYKNKKKTHYEALLQQQHQEYEQQRPTTSAAAAQTTDHYSVPHTIQRVHPIRNNFHNHPNYYHHHSQPHLHYHFVPHKPHRTPAPAPPPVPAHMHYSASVGVQSNNNDNTHSSSSMFCISSEVSIPMGSNATSSTTTTTHQYDDVAAGVGIQTSDSILRSHPIFGPRRDRPLVGDCISGTTLDCKIAAQSASIQVKPKSIAYVISFDQKTKSESSPNSPTYNVEATLQEHLQRAKPNFCAQSKERKAILNQIQALRQERERELRHIVENTSINSLDRKLMKLPPAPTIHTRIFPTKEMKAMTNKRYARLPEVLERQKREREERRRRSNRILRDVFNWRLQKRVRNGKLSLNHSRTVI